MFRATATAFALLLLALGVAAEPFAPKVLAKLGSDRFRYPGTIANVTVSPDSKYVAVSGSAPTWVYDFATGRPVWQSRHEPGDVFFGSFGQAFRGDRFLTLQLDSADGLVIHHYHLVSGQLVHTTKVKANGEGAFSPDGELLAVPAGRRVTLLDTATGREVNRVLLPRGAGKVQGVVFSPDGRRLAVKSDKGAVHTFDRLTGRELARFKPKPEVRTFALSPDGNRLSAVLYDNSLESLNLLTGARKRWKVGDQTFDQVLGLGGDRILTVEQSQMKLQVFDAATGRLVRKLPAGPFAEGFAVTADGRTLIYGSNVSSFNDGAVTACDVATGRTLPQSADPCGYASFRFHGPDRLVGVYPTSQGVGIEQYTWSEWRLPGGPRLPLPVPPGNRPADLSRDGLWALAAANNQVTVVNTVTGKAGRTLTLPPGTVVAAAWFKDTDRQVGVCTGDAVVVWDPTANRTRRLEIGANTDAVPSGGRWFAWGELISEPNKPVKQRLYTLDLDTGRRGFEQLFSPADDVRFTPDGTRLVRLAQVQTFTPDGTSEQSQEVQFLDPATGRIVRQFTSAAQDQLLDIAADGRTILTAGDNAFVSGSRGVVAATEVATGKVRWRLPDLGEWSVTGGSFAPDGRRIAVSSTDGFVRVWDIGGKGNAPPDALAAANLWDALGNPDAEKAFAAICTLGQFPEAAVPLLKAKVPPAVAVDPDKVAGWLVDLDSPEFAVRDAATRKLAAVVPQARPAMEALLKTTPSPEVRERLTTLLDGAVRLTSAEVRTVRAAGVLERIGTNREASAEARRSAVELLHVWADGAAGALLTTEAKETLTRLRVPAAK